MKSTRPERKKEELNISTKHKEEKLGNQTKTTTRSEKEKNRKYEDETKEENI